MLQSKLFYKTTKNKTAGADSVSHDLLTRAGYIDQLMAGVYTFLPLGFKVLKILKLSSEKYRTNWGQEMLMSILHPKEIWQKTGRWDALNDILFKIKGNADKEYVLASTHEESIIPPAKKIILSYRDLPLYAFHIQLKFRDELRVKSGILRTKEFIMKDLYSFHANQADLDKYYEIAAKAYEKVFRECGIEKITYRTLADGGSFSKYSDEFQMLTEAGEDIIYICKNCSIAINKEIKNENLVCPKCKNGVFEEKKAVEVGNIFKLGTRFSAPFDLKFTDKDAHDKLVIMGCYGIGLSRLMGAIVEASHDDNGIIWPKNVAPFLVHVIQIENTPKVKKEAQIIYKDLQGKSIEVLYDDRQHKYAGEKFAESDLMGIPYRIVVSAKTLEKNSVEIKERGKEKTKLVKIKQLGKFLKNA